MKQFVVISHTHWDREWYMPFEAFRLKLVDLVDRLLEIVKRDKDYIFHLDAQTVVLEDYLEIRPEKRGELKKSISSGNIVVGPWYLQNDFYLTSGESTVRNLLRGKKLAQEFGACSKAGYAPDQFGNPSQMPQILNGFGIDTYVFGRGRSEYEATDGGFRPVPQPTEFIWEAPDGSKCLAVFMAQWYNNAQHIPAQTDKANLLLDINEKCFEGLNVSPYVLLMNGVDHLEAQEDVSDILQRLRKEGRDIKQYRLDDYLSELKQYLKENKSELPVTKGALNRGKDDQMLRGCWSSRSYIKTENVKAQTMLENKLEPLYSILERSGLAGVTPQDHLNYLWKNLLKNHPHDSICCCSRDEVHKHMEDNYEKLAEMSGEMFRRGLTVAALHAQVYRPSPDHYVAAVCNPTEEKLSDVVEFEFDFPAEEGVMEFKVVDPEGAEVPVSVLGHETARLDVFSGVNLPGVLTVDRYRVLCAFKDVPPLSVRGYSVIPNEPSLAVKSKDGLENEFYRIVREGGKIDILCKKSGVTICDAIRFEDQGDRGDSYIFVPAGEPAIYSEPDNTSVTVTEDDPLRKTIRVETTLRIPKRFDFEQGRRSEAKVPVNCSYTLTMKKNSDVLELSYEVDNRAEDHRLRIGIDSAIASDVVLTDSAFDCSETGDADFCPAALSKTVCNATFAAMTAEGRGFALLTEGLHDAERIGSTVYLTIVRSTGMISRAPLGRQWEVPGNQCKRVFTGRIGLYGFGNEVVGSVFARAKQFRTGLPALFTSQNPKKFAGGRFAVQDSKLEQLYYVPDPFEGKQIPDGFVLTWGNRNIVMSAFKLAEDGSGLILRLFNVTDRDQRTRLAASGEIFACNLAETDFKLMGSDACDADFPPKGIRTFKLAKNAESSAENRLGEKK